MNFDELPEADRAAVLAYLMTHVSAYMRDEVFLLSQQGRHKDPTTIKWYAERLEESQRMAVVWRAAVAKLQGVG